MIEAGDLLADRAYTQLSTAILRNELPPGTSLSVPELARRLGISRSPVREAVQRLIWDGLADYRGRRGTVVVDIDLSDFLRLLEVREVLEALAARLAAERGSDAQRDDLRQIHQEFESLKSSDASQWAFLEIDMRFHAAIRAMSHNQDLDTTLARSQGRAHLSLNTLWRRERNLRVTQREHAAICEAIVDGDTDRAESAARTHIACLGQRVLAMWVDHD
ncbi:MAG: GntR family transcriptional regulator, partial [Acidimicrobiaceae bacterium]|nr:GntR family transcriptional regulator [Acidimicrobiaceae bacterium]